MEAAFGYARTVAITERSRALSMQNVYAEPAGGDVPIILMMIKIKFVIHNYGEQMLLANLSENEDICIACIVYLSNTEETVFEITVAMTLINYFIGSEGEMYAGIDAEHRNRIENRG